MRGHPEADDGGDFSLVLGGSAVPTLPEDPAGAPPLDLLRRRVIAFTLVACRWIHGGASPDEPLVGSGDIQSLADLDGSFDVVRGMPPFPFGKETVIQLAVTVVLPGLPLVLTVIPLEELAMRLLGAPF